MKTNKVSSLILLIFLLTNLQYVHAEHNGSFFYVSPGLQFAYNKANGYSVTAQITLGYVADDHKQNLLPGITLGTRKYIKSDVKYSYADVQLSLGYGGVGIGKIFGSDQQFSKYRIKVWGGFLWNFTYDGILDNGKLINKNIGIIGVAPLPIPLLRGKYVL